MTSKSAFRSLAIIWLLGLVSATVHAQVFVITHPATQIGPNEIKEVFVGDKQFSGSTKLIPVDNAAVQDAFLASAIRVDSGRYNTIWTKKSFREGLNPPPVKSGDFEVIEFVKKTPGAVGYVSSQPNGVNIVTKY
jgi:hypothetical protein